MPTGYIGMFLMALIPPLWFRVMNPRIRAISQDSRSEPPEDEKSTAYRKNKATSDSRP